MIGNAHLTLENNVMINNTSATSPVIEVVTGGVFEMNGGTISNNNVTAVCAYGGTVIMNGGLISGNNHTYGHGAGVSILVNGKFIMNGGEISGNTAYSYGGGVAVLSGTFIMNDGLIKDNIANSISPEPLVQQRGGGGVSVYYTAISGQDQPVFTMNGGTISNNKTVNDFGGGVRVNALATFNMNGGTIKDNTSVGGGGIFINSNSYENVHIASDVVFSGNTADEDLYVYDGTPDITNNIKTTSSSYPGLHPLNKHDINYTGGSIAVSGVTYYLVTFKDWDDTILKYQSVASGTGAIAPATSAREGYIFTDWDIDFDNVTSNLGHPQKPLNQHKHWTKQPFCGIISV